MFRLGGSTPTPMRVTYTAPVSSAHGRAGTAQGLTLRQSLGQNIASRTAAPSRAPSPRQIAGRALLSTVRRAFALLSPAQLEAWHTFAIAAKKTDRISPPHPSAWSGYLAINTWRSMALLALIDTPPPLLPTGTFTKIWRFRMYDYTPGFFQITITGVTFNLDTDYLALRVALPMHSPQRRATPSELIYTSPVSERCLFKRFAAPNVYRFYTTLRYLPVGTLVDAIITPYNSDFLPGIPFEVHRAMFT